MVVRKWANEPTNINDIKKQVFIFRCPYCKNDQVVPWENNPRSPGFMNKHAYVKCNNCGANGIDVRDRIGVVKEKVKKK